MCVWVGVCCGWHQLSTAWREFAGRLRRVERQVAGADSSFAFAFVEGGLVRALREGHWLLLDEANLAPPETLERLSGVLEGAAGSIALTEKGDIDTVSQRRGTLHHSYRKPAAPTTGRVIHSPENKCSER